MPVKPNDSVALPDLVAAARQIIRREGNHCVIEVFQLLDELSDKFGDRFAVSTDTCKVLNLIETLWDDPHIDQVPSTGSIEFAWREEAFDPATFAADAAVLGD